MGLLAIGMASVAPCNETVATSGPADATSSGLSGTQIAINTSVSIALITLSGLVAGLTLGLLSLDRLELEVVKRSGSSNKRKWAARVMPLLRNPHWLLVSLVLVNAACNTSLPIFLDRMVSPAVAIVLSTTAVLIFGEILPQAVCARHGIVIGGALSWVVRIILMITSPISWPTGQLLDWILGREEKAHGRRQLKTLVALHAKDEGLGGNLIDDEIKIIRGVLDLAGKDAATAMTPLDRVFALPADALLSRRCLAAVLRTGLSRVPIWRRGPAGYPEFLGFLLTKEILQQVDSSRPIRAGEAPMRVLPHLSVHTSLFDLLKFFSSGATHIAVLTVPQPELAALLRTLAGPASTISTHGSDSSDESSDDDDGSSASTRSSSSSFSSSGSSGSSRGSSQGSREGRANSSGRGTGTARSSPGGVGSPGAQGPSVGRPSFGSARWRTAEHRIRAVLRLLSGGRRKRRARMLTLEQAAHDGGRGSGGQSHLVEVTAAREGSGSDAQPGEAADQGQPPPLRLLGQRLASKGDQAPGAAGTAGVLGRVTGGEVGDQLQPVPSREVELSAMGMIAAEQLSRTAAAVLHPEGASADETGFLHEPEAAELEVEPGVPGALQPEQTELSPGSGPGQRQQHPSLQPAGDVVVQAAIMQGRAAVAGTPHAGVLAVTAAPSGPQAYRPGRHHRRLYHGPSPAAQLRSLKTYGLGPGVADSSDVPNAIPELARVAATAELQEEVATGQMAGPSGMAAPSPEEAEAEGGHAGRTSRSLSHPGARWLNSAAAAAEMLVPVGIITLEDVIEELMQVEILDETDTRPLSGAGQTPPPPAWPQNHADRTRSGRGH